MQRNCIQCGKTDVKFRCSICHHAHYCGPTCQFQAWPYHKNHCYPIPLETFLNGNNKMLHKALHQNLFKEFKQIEFFNPPPIESFQLGRFHIFRGIIGMILFDPVWGDHKPKMTPEMYTQWDEFHADIRKGGELVNETGRMRDPLIWLFIPKEFWCSIEMKWDGIGEWRG